VAQDRLLKLDEAARILGLQSGATFSRFAKRHRIPLVRFGSRIVRVREEELEAAIRSHEQQQPVTPTRRGSSK